MKFPVNNHQLVVVVVVALLASSFVASTKKLDEDDNDFSTNDHTILSAIENKLQQQQSVPSIEKLLKQLRKRSLNASSEPEQEQEQEQEQEGNSAGQKWYNIGKYFGKGKKQSGNNTKNENEKVNKPSVKDWIQLKKFESNLMEMISFFQQFRNENTTSDEISMDDLTKGQKKLQDLCDMFVELLEFGEKMEEANKVATFRPIFLLGKGMKQLWDDIEQNVPNAKNLCSSDFNITLFDEFISNLPQNKTFDILDVQSQIFRKKISKFLISSVYGIGGAGLFAAYAFGLMRRTTEHPSQIGESPVANGLQLISNGTPTPDSYTLTNILVICIIVLLLVGLIATALVLIFRCFGKRSMDQLDNNQPPLPAKSGAKSRNNLRSNNTAREQFGTQQRKMKKRRNNDNNNIDLTKSKSKTKTISSTKKKQRNKRQTKSEKTKKIPNDSSSTTPTFVPTTPENSAKQETSGSSSSSSGNSAKATENTAEIHKSGQLPPPQPPPPRKKSSQRQEVSKSQTPNPDKKKSVPRNLISPGPFRGGEVGATASSSKKKESGSPKQKVLLPPPLPASKISNQTKERTLEMINKSKLSQLGSSDLGIPSFGSYQMKTEFNSSDDGSVVDTVTSSV